MLKTRKGQSDDGGRFGSERAGEQWYGQPVLQKELLTPSDAVALTSAKALLTPFLSTQSNVMSQANETYFGFSGNSAH